MVRKTTIWAVVVGGCIFALFGIATIWNWNPHRGDSTESEISWRPTEAPTPLQSDVWSGTSAAPAWNDPPVIAQQVDLPPPELSVKAKPISTRKRRSYRRHRQSFRTSSAMTRSKRQESQEAPFERPVTDNEEERMAANDRRAFEEARRKRLKERQGGLD
jgi:hypothetical protein